MGTSRQLPASMSALVWNGPCQMEIEKVAVPAPGPGDVLIEVSAAGICGSELSGYLGQNSLRVPPLVMGHEFSGRVVAVGDDATVARAFGPGQRVAINPMIGCGVCAMCSAGLPNLCRQRRIIGAHCAGGFAGYATVPAIQCTPLPDSVSDVAGALTEPLACAVRAVQHAQWREEGALLILGAGTIGLFCLAVARASGAHGTVVISDIVEERLSVAQAWGATTAINGRNADATQALRAVLPDGAACVIDAVGADATRALALQMVRPGGRAVYIGLHDERSPLAANYLVRQEITIQGSFAYTPTDFAGALDLLASAAVVPSAVWVEERPLSMGAAAFAGLVDGSITVAKIVLTPE